MINFEKYFEEYIVDWYKNNADKYSDMESAEEIVVDVYEDWINIKIPDIGNKSPLEYFNEINDADTLINMFKQNCESMLVQDRIVSFGKCEKQLEQLVFDTSADIKVREGALEIIYECDYAIDLGKCVNLIMTEKSEDLCEIAVSMLGHNADKVSQMIYDKISKADEIKKSMLVEILIAGKKDEKTYNILTECFLSGDNVPLYAYYIGKYKDKRHIDILSKALGSSDYADYTEIRNALENLGEMVESERDFSDDEAYKKVKEATIEDDKS